MLTLEEKKEMIETGMENLKKKLLEAIEKAPEEWDGVELRWLIRDKAAEFVYSCFQDKRQARYREYKNTVLVNNL